MIYLLRDRDNDGIYLIEAKTPREAFLLVCPPRDFDGSDAITMDVYGTSGDLAKCLVADDRPTATYGLRARPPKLVRLKARAA